MLPSEPTEAYRHLSADRLEAVRKTERIPFPCIRELILMYVLPDSELIDITPSELLTEKINSTPLQNQY